MYHKQQLSPYPNKERIGLEFQIAEAPKTIPCLLLVPEKSQKTHIKQKHFPKQPGGLSKSCPQFRCTILCIIPE